jgi:hypothetical protein
MIDLARLPEEARIPVSNREHQNVRDALIDVRRLRISTQSPVIRISETVSLVEDDSRPFAE